MFTAEEIDRANVIHRELHTRFRWTSDKDVYGVPERWGRLLSRGGWMVGDCDDWAMEMDHLLAHTPAEDRRFAVCRLSQRTAETYDHCALILVGEDMWVSECNQRGLVKLANLRYDLWHWNPPGRLLSDPWVRVPGAR